MDLSIKFCAFEWAVGGFGGKVCNGPFFIRIKDHEISRSACLDTAARKFVERSRIAGHFFQKLCQSEVSWLYKGSDAKTKRSFKACDTAWRFCERLGFFFDTVWCVVGGDQVDCAVFEPLNDLLAVFSVRRGGFILASVPCSRSASSVSVK